MATIFLVTYNYDYEESAFSFRTRAEALEHIADTFEIEFEHDTKEFWEELDDAYANGNWKGFQFYSLDTDTLQIGSCAK